VAAQLAASQEGLSSMSVSVRINFLILITKDLGAHVRIMVHFNIMEVESVLYKVVGIRSHDKKIPRHFIVSEDTSQFSKESQSYLRYIMSLNEIVFIGMN
jgi:hypothetical protein